MPEGALTYTASAFTAPLPSISPRILVTRRRASGHIVSKSMMSAQSCPIWSR